MFFRRKRPKSKEIKMIHDLGDINGHMVVFEVANDVPREFMRDLAALLEENTTGCKAIITRGGIKRVYKARGEPDRVIIRDLSPGAMLLTRTNAVVRTGEDAITPETTKGTPLDVNPDGKWRIAQGEPAGELYEPMSPHDGNITVEMYY